MVTKTLLFAPEGNNLWVTPAGGGGKLLRILDKATGKLIHQIQLPAMATGVPMTYLANNRQYVVVAVGAAGFPAELIALALP
jgi:quinoprotein glucose dehydrogenase